MITRGSLVRSSLPVLALVFFGLLLTSPELLHAHHSGESGLYNTECPLAEIAARHSDAPLPSAPPVVAPWSMVEMAPALAPGHVLALFARSADSRAPPIV
jgi:hypothetical protein